MLSPPHPNEIYPFTLRSLDLPAGKYHYVDEGAGAPLLFVHGNPTWSFYWHELIKAFRDRYRAVAVDHIGCGLSDRPARYNYTLTAHIDNLVALIDNLDLADITLLVHDWGGANGLGAALQRPERFSRFVLFNTGAFPPPFVPLRIRACRFPLLGQFAVRGLNVFARAAIHMAVSKPERMTTAVKSGLLAPYSSWRHRAGIWGFIKDIPLTRRHPTWRVLEEIEAGLASLNDRPVQLIWGMQDWCFNEVCLERFQRIFPQAEVHRLEDAGHYVVLDAYERIIPLVSDFLTRSSVPATTR
jgi:haloalkane dehalogenase